MKNKIQVIIKGKDQTDTVLDVSTSGGKVGVTFANGETYFYNESNVQLKKSALSDARALECFEYLKRIAEITGLQVSKAGNTLSGQYSKINFIDPDSIFSAFLSGNAPRAANGDSKFAVYPFNFNASQKKAVENALAYPLTIIEGPPGTGKTQTVLNIIANAVMRGESVAVVSSNNSATANVVEKLQKHGIDFITAYLGNYDNKQEFINAQKPLPDLKNWKLPCEEERAINQSLHSLHASLNEMLAKKNELSQTRQQFRALNLEYKHFCEYANYSDEFVSRYLNQTNANTALELWLECEKYAERGKSPGIFARLVNRFRRGVVNKLFYSEPPETMIALCQKRWYMAKIDEIECLVLQLKKELDGFDFDTKMSICSDLSMKLFRSYLAEKYMHTGRSKFTLDDLRNRPNDFGGEYPVILATTYSLRNSLSHKVMYDYVIIDEASQVNLVTGALALSCAQKAVIIGDLKQLPNVVAPDLERRTDSIFSEFNLPEAYRYKNHSLLATVSELFPQVPRTLLREHYRCHPQIIEFCNQKFYNNQLVVLTEPTSERQPLVVYKTRKGNHARDNVNQRQIDVIKNEVIPQQCLGDNTVSLGIVTPYRNQTNALQEVFCNTSIQADTVDKFQGRERDVIILSTVDNKISEFTDNANRLNVAVSRAIKQLIVVMNGEDDAPDTNIGDLVRYIKYNNIDTIHSSTYSVFDYLYGSYRNERNRILQKQGRISEYDSENLMYVLIRDLLALECFMKLGVATHVPLKMIICDTDKLTEDEKRYAGNILTHVDFLIFDKLGKLPLLAIEVDGVAFHKAGSRQAERDKLKNGIFEKYGLPLIRFKTDGSGERERLYAKLNHVLAHSTPSIIQ